MNVRKLLVGGGVLLLAIQAVPVSRTNPPVESDADAPPAVKALLKRACYDCHSHETKWPAQAWVAPASWLVVHDVNEGREELNFSRWAAIDPARRAKLAKELPEEVAEGEMPPWSYRIAHSGARLSDAEKALLVEWVRGLGR